MSVPSILGKYWGKFLRNGFCSQHPYYMQEKLLGHLQSAMYYSMGTDLERG